VRPIAITDKAQHHKHLLLAFCNFLLHFSSTFFFPVKFRAHCGPDRRIFATCLEKCQRAGRRRHAATAWRVAIAPVVRMR